MYAMLIISVAVFTPTLFLARPLLTYRNERFNLMFAMLCISYAALIVTLVLASVLK